MLKKIFGPKITAGVGEPVSPDALREALLELFPSDAEFNQQLKIEPLEGSPNGFQAVCVLNTEHTEEGYTTYHRTTNTIRVDIRPQEKTVRFSQKEDSPKIDRRVVQEQMNAGERFYTFDLRYTHLRVGRLEELKEHEKNHIETAQSQKVIKNGTKQTRYQTYRFWDFSSYKKRIREELVGCATGLGWDAYF